MEAANGKIRTTVDLEKWSKFKEDLPHQQPPFSKRGWGGAVHSMCSYQGKLKPSLAHHLIRALTKEGEVVVDPFSGAGTIPYEACRMGRVGVGVDLSSLGYALTAAKVSSVNRNTLNDCLSALSVYIEKFSPNNEDLDRARSFGFNSTLSEYYEPNTLKEILAARKFFCDRWGDCTEWALMLACTAHLLHGNRPYALSRRSHPVTPFRPTGEFEYRKLMPRLRAKLERVLAARKEELSEVQGIATRGDSTKIWPKAVPLADAVITSPPFFDSTRFYMTNWIRYWFVGWERDDFKRSVSDFVETRQKLDLDVYRDFFQAAAERMRKGAIMLLHLGNSKKCDMAAELTERVPSSLYVEDQFTELVEHCESHGVRDKGSTTGHSYVLLRRG